MISLYFKSTIILRYNSDIHNRTNYDRDLVMFSENELNNIKREMAKLKNNVVLKLFTDFKTQEDGSKLRKCMSCEGVHELLKTLEEFSNGKLHVIEISTEENVEEAEKYMFLGFQRYYLLMKMTKKLLDT